MYCAKEVELCNDGLLKLQLGYKGTGGGKFEYHEGSTVPAKGIGGGECTMGKLIASNKKGWVASVEWGMLGALGQPSNGC